MSGALELACARYHYLLEEVDALSDDDAPSGRRPRLFADADDQTRTTRGVRVTASRGGAQQWSLVLDDAGHTTPLHEHSAVCLRSWLAVVIGSSCMCLDGASGSIVWRWPSDQGKCLAVELVDDGRALILRADRAIVCLSVEGRMLWRYVLKGQRSRETDD
jgi:putative pyrroloquinoline-quinone binding quinoprotein